MTKFGLSIIIPISNRAELLDKTLESYKFSLNSFNNYEILIMSRGTTDNLLQVIEKHKNLNIKLIKYTYPTTRDKINPSYAFNYGVKLSKYDHIALTSPEIMHVGPIIEKIMSSIKENKFPAVICKAFYLQRDGSRGIEIFSSTVKSDNPGMYFFGVYNKEKYLSIGGLDEEFMKGIGFEDTDFGERWVRAGLSYIIADELVVLHQWHQTIDPDSYYKINEQIYLSNKTNEIVYVDNSINICGFMQVYNELEKGNLERAIKNLKSFCKHIVIYDDGSTDGSYDYCIEQGCDVLKGNKNDFINETNNKQKLLNFALEKHKDIDFFFWLDADEILCDLGTKEIKNFCRFASLDGYAFPEITLWRSETWKRKDYLGNGIFTRLWRNNNKLKFNIKTGLHNQLYPDGLGRTEVLNNYPIIHYGYATKKAIEDRWIERTKLGVPKNIRIKGIQEENMVLESVNTDLFPEYCRPQKQEKPTPIKYEVS